jgi:hypothetical protein
MDKVGYGLRTDERVMGGLGVLYIMAWVGERERDCLLMVWVGWVKKWSSSIVMYNLGDGHGGPYVFANLEGHQSNLLFW